MLYITIYIYSKISRGANIQQGGGGRRMPVPPTKNPDYYKTEVVKITGSMMLQAYYWVGIMIVSCLLLYFMFYDFVPVVVS